MKSEMPEPLLWSDFDGTAVRILSKADPRNWSKYPIPGVAGYLTFLRGVQNGGVKVEGVVSRWPNIAPRRLATSRSIAKLGLDEFFSDPDKIVLAGNEANKGSFVVQQSEHAPIGLVDDKPHRVGPAILDALLATEPDTRAPLHELSRRVSLGVVPGANAAEYTERFIDKARSIRGETGIKVVERTNDGTYHIHGPRYSFELDVVPLPSYTQRAGEVFATYLQDPGNTLVR